MWPIILPLKWQPITPFDDQCKQAEALWEVKSVNEEMEVE